MEVYLYFVSCNWGDQTSRLIKIWFLLQLQPAKVKRIAFMRYCIVVDETSILLISSPTERLHIEEGGYEGRKFM